MRKRKGRARGTRPSIGWLTSKLEVEAQTQVGKCCAGCCLNNTTADGCTAAHVVDNTQAVCFACCVFGVHEGFDCCRCANFERCADAVLQGTLVVSNCEVQVCDADVASNSQNCLVFASCGAVLEAQSNSPTGERVRSPRNR